MPHYTIQSPSSSDEYLLGELASESFGDFDRARKVALYLCQEYRADVQLVEHLGAHSYVRELYDAALYA